MYSDKRLYPEVADVFVTMPLAVPIPLVAGFSDVDAPSGRVAPCARRMDSAKMRYSFVAEEGTTSGASVVQLEGVVSNSPHDLTYPISSVLQ